MNWQLYLIFMMPAFILLVVFKYLPMGGILIAFQDYSGIRGLLGSEWVGLDNFSRFLSSTEFWRLFGNTLQLSVYNLLWSFFPPIILALLLARIRSRGIRSKIQLFIYAPNFISIIVLAGMVFVFLSPVGPINQFFGTQINFMAEPSAYRTIYIASGIWQSAGWASIIYTAALSGVSQDLVEAAKIDGASLWKRIQHIELPTLKPIMIIQFILSAGHIMSIGFEKSLALQTDLNLATSQIIPTYVYQIGINMGDYGYSTAVDLFNSVINIILLLSVNKIVSKLNNNEGL
ncbi:ABC transporter permease [Paenibacillus sanguinis]|uniref:ABC transporter permease n=1 Tax=Paenibacillus sanguinis TaxID=225906 RepID=UPI00039C70EE|nr:ABC transporter permease subunit [Paenibacillus sanguinis]